MGAIFDDKLKQVKSATNKDFTDAEHCAIKKKKDRKIRNICFKFFFGKTYFCNDGSQNFWTLQPILNTSLTLAGFLETLVDGE